MKMITKSEAEMHLNFNPLPDNETQKKIDYFITPYNSAKVVTKFMNFNEKETQGHVQLDSWYKWKKISGMILNQDKYSLRNTLSTINDKLYKTIDHALRMNNTKKLPLQKKRVKFMGSQVDNPNAKPSRRMLAPPKRVTKSHRYKTSPLFAWKINEYKNSTAPRKSIISTVLEGIRESQDKLREKAEQKKQDKTHKAEIVRLFTRSKSLNFSNHKDPVRGIQAKNGLKNSYSRESKMSHAQKSEIGDDLKPICSVLENDQELLESSWSSFDSSVPSHKKRVVNQALLLELLKGEHQVFRKHQSNKKIFLYKPLQNGRVSTNRLIDTKDTTPCQPHGERSKTKLSSARKNFFKYSTPTICFKEGYPNQCLRQTDKSSPRNANQAASKLSHPGLTILERQQGWIELVIDRSLKWPLALVLKNIARTRWA